jgi:hypothetical protein
LPRPASRSASGGRTEKSGRECPGRIP